MTDKPMQKLENRRLGRTEMTPACLGLGGAWWRSEADTTAGIERALDLGMNFLDTYPGQNEERWQNALAGSRRNDIYLQGKVSSHVRNEMTSDHTAAATRRSVENSLRCFGTDYLDSVLIHGYDQPDVFEVHDTAFSDPLAPGNALDELVKLREEGKVRHIGIGARHHDVINRAVDTGEIDLVLTYLEYNLLTQAAVHDFFPKCREHDVGVILASPLGMGLLTGRPVDAAEEHRKIRDTTTPRAADMLTWCQERDLDIRHLAIQFCLKADVESIVLPGQASVEEVEGTYEAATSVIPDSTWQAFADAFSLETDIS